MHLPKSMVGARGSVLYAKANLYIWMVSTSGILLCKARVTLGTGTLILQVFGRNTGVFMMILSKRTFIVNKQFPMAVKVYTGANLRLISGAHTRKASGIFP